MTIAEYVCAPAYTVLGYLRTASKSGFIGAFKLSFELISLIVSYFGLPFPNNVIPGTV
jgi:hypothetical protein